ncbi:MFS transporter [Streptosporangium sp. NPDC006013]|uniref:MFS transporter n=1 Tax=Streptosporangium sp. NPDC006013 TaxID=3155596 RepID=UPI0033B4CBAB
MSVDPGGKRHTEGGGLVRAVVDWAVRRMAAVVGGPARFRIIVLLGCVLALVAADQATVGAVGVEVKRSLGITNTELGSLSAVSSGAGALAVLPVGVLTDRARRVRILAVSLAVWSLAMLVSGLADSFLWLLLSRLALGAVTAAAGPTIASLVGDFFPAAERGRIYGFILSGEMLGAGFGLLIGGNLAYFLSWRSAFWFLGLLGIVLMFVIVRKLPEPERGGQSRLLAGATSLTSGPGDSGEDGSGRARDRDDAARSAVRDRGIEPDPALVLHRDPVRMSMWQAVRYVLRIRTNVVLIIASAVGYFFFAGLRIFGVVFVHQQYGLSQAAVTGLIPLVGFGALLGVLCGGRIADWFARRGRVSARMVVPAVAYLTGAAFCFPGLLTTSVAIALPFLFVSAGSLSAANPPLDAARLDVVHFRLWGRAESIRTFLRTGAETAAPVTFGFLADVLDQGGTKSAQGLQYTFLIMLVPLIANAIILLYGRRAYPRDVATATASERMTDTGRGRTR